MSTIEDPLPARPPPRRHWLTDRVQAMMKSQQQQQQQQQQQHQHQQQSEPGDQINEEVKAAFREDDYRLLPVLVGCIIPVSILINVPSISSPWVSLQTYNETTNSFEDPATEVDIPHYMNALVITALVNAVICNVFIFVRFLEHHVWMATVMGLITATIQDILSLAAVIPFCIEFKTSAGYVYEEGFWTMVASMAFSFAATMLMSIDLHMTPNFRARGSGVTHKQRILIIEAMSFCFYLAVGALCVIFIEPGWTFLEALFFAMVTITTIGFGDRVMKTTGGRIFTVIYAAGGIVLFAVCINGIRYVIMEDLHQQFAHRARERKAKREAERRKKRDQQRIRRRLRRLQQMGRQGQAQTNQEDNPESTGTIYQQLANWALRRLPSQFSNTRSQSDPPNKSAAARTPTSKLPDARTLFRHPASSPNLYRAHTVDGTEGIVSRVDYSPSFNSAAGIQPPTKEFVETAATTPPQRPASIEAAESEKALMPDEADSESNRSTFGSDTTNIDMFSDVDSGQEDDTPIDAQDGGSNSDGNGNNSESDGDGDESDREKGKGILFRLNPFRRQRRHPRLAPGSKQQRSASLTTHELLDQERRQAYRESMDEYRRRVQVWVTIFIFFWVLGATVFTFVEDWDYLTSIYFVFVAFSSIGYGDVVPQTLAGRSFFLGYCLMGVVAVTSLASVVSEALSKKMRRHVVDAQLKKHRLRAESRGRSHGETHRTSGAGDGVDSRDLELGLNQTSNGSAVPRTEHRDDAFSPEEEKKYRAELKQMVKVTQNFHNLLQHVLAPSRLEQAGASGGTANSPHSTHSPRPHHQSPPTLSMLNTGSTPASPGREATNFDTQRSVYEYLDDSEDNPSISRDLEGAREELVSHYVRRHQGSRSPGKSRAPHLESSLQTYHGFSSHPFTSSPDQIRIMEWPTSATPTTSPPPGSPSYTHPEQPRQTYSSTGYTPQYNQSKSTHPTNPLPTTTSSPPAHPRINHILRTTERPLRRLRPSASFSSDDLPATASLAPQMPPLHHHNHRHHHQQGASEPHWPPQDTHHHILKIERQVFDQLCAYADECQRMMGDFEVAMDRMAAWERRERKLQRRRRQVCARQEALLREREERASSLVGQRGDVGDAIEDEQELIELTRQSIRCLAENPLWQRGENGATTPRGASSTHDTTAATAAVAAAAAGDDNNNSDDNGPENAAGTGPDVTPGS